MSMIKSETIARNTLMLYFRQILTMFVSLFTVRIVLNVLGAEDYGLYNVISGVVTMFSFISGSMASASQRYFCFELGKEDNDKLKKTFSITFEIYLFLIIITLIISETLGLWFINNKLVIPQSRLTAANWIYQFAILSFVLTLITTPYMAAIIAHECMDVYAYMSILEVVLKLIIVFLLKLIPLDKLIIYGFLWFGVNFITTFIYRLYCSINFTECHFRVVIDRELFKELISYSLWNLFGASTGVIKNQITNILLNLRFGPVVNAGKGIATQVENAVVSFANNFSKAMDPAIVKGYAAGEINEVEKFIHRSSKLTYFLVFIFTLPLVLEMNFVLNVWLKAPPNYAVLFTQLALLDSLLDSPNYAIKTLAQATGKIKLYQAVIGGIKVLNLPIVLLILKFTSLPAYYVYIVSITLTILSSVVRFFIIKLITVFSIKRFLMNVIIPCTIVSMLALLIPALIKYNMQYSFLRFVLVVGSSVVMTITTILFVGFSKNERVIFKEMIKRKIGEGRNGSKS